MPTLNDFIPDAPKTVILKPLTKGMDLSDDDQQTTDMRRIAGADATTLGLRKHGSWNNVYSSALVPLLPNEVFQRVGQLTLIDGDIASFIVSNRALYYFDADTGFEIVSWHQLYDAVGTPGANTVVVAGTIKTTLGLGAGDYVILPDGAYLITDITESTDSTITVATNWTTPPSSGFKIVKPFAASDQTVVDFACGRGTAYFVDGISSTIWAYNGSFMDAHSIMFTGTSTAALLGASAVVVFKERLYFANVIDGSAGSSTRVRWTDVLDWTKSSAANYQDLESAVSPLMALKSTEDYLAAFSVGDVFYSRPTSLESLPYAFYKAETGNVGPVGPMATTTIMNAILFVGVDDVYIFSYTDNNGPSTQRIATKVADEMLSDVTLLQKTMCATDTENSRVIVAVPTAAGSFSKMWLFNMKTNAWTLDEANTLQMIGSSIFTNQWRCSDFAITVLCSSGEYATRTCSSFYVMPSRPQLVVFTTGNYMQTYDPNGASATTFEVVTKSLDFDAPVDRKVFTQAVVRVDGLDGGVTLTLKVRLDESTTWRTLGTFSLTETQNEDILSFRATGRRAQFKLESTTNTSPWYLKYIALRVKAKGRMTAEGRY